MPRTDKPETSFSPLIRQLPLDTPGIVPPATPIPDPCPSSSPAWDPSSRTPQPNHDADYSFASPSSPSHPVDPEHPLLDARLVNVGLKVVADGGEHKGKELSIFVMSTEGRLSFRRRKYNTLTHSIPVTYVAGCATATTAPRKADVRSIDQTHAGAATRRSSAPTSISFCP